MSTDSNRANYEKKENEHFPCFYHKILFCSRKHFRLNYMLYFIMKILKKQELYQVAINHLSNFVFQGFTKNVQQNTVFFGQV